VSEIIRVIHVPCNYTNSLSSKASTVQEVNSYSAVENTKNHKVWEHIPHSCQNVAKLNISGENQSERFKILILKQITLLSIQ